MGKGSKNFPPRRSRSTTKEKKRNLITLESIPALLEKAITAREGLLDGGHTAALRLFNGFLEGQADLVVDLYGRTLVLQDYSDVPEEGLP